MNREELEKRKAEMMAMRDKRISLDKIGRKFGISRERVRQVIGNTGARRYAERGTGRRVFTFTIGLTKKQRAHWVGQAEIQGISKALYVQGLFEKDMEEHARMEQLKKEAKNEVHNKE